MKTTISRNPAPAELHDQQLIDFRTGCKMAPDAADLMAAAKERLANRITWPTVALDRAMRAGVELRLQALEATGLRNWKSAILALFGVTNGFMDRRVSDLFKIVYAARQKSEAARVVEAFDAARPTFGFLDTLVMEALRAVTYPCPLTEADKAMLKSVAILCGLHAQNGVYEFRESWGHYKVGQKLDLDATMKSGIAKFGPPAMPKLLQSWARLANQRGENVPPPEGLDRESILNWARRVLEASEEKEGTDTPNASVQEAEKGVFLSWDGTWTEGRNFRMSVAYKGDAIEEISVSWCSGTSQPSRFLSIHTLLRLPDLKEFGSVM